MKIKILISKVVWIIFHYLRYFNLVKYDYKINSKVDFGSKIANNFFLSKLKNSKLYLEYGSGSSTLIARKLKKYFFSVESDKNFFLYLKSKLQIFNKSNNNLKYDLRFIDFGPVSFYSLPIFFPFRNNYLKLKAHSYANDVLFYLEKNNKLPDLILIDGRYRVLCGLYVYMFLNKQQSAIKNKNITILLDDYRERQKEYCVLKKFYKITTIGRVGCLSIKNLNIFKANILANNLINKFCFDYN
jgi:hypothetical protein